jgi:hypothetical protein
MRVHEAVSRSKRCVSFTLIPPCPLRPSPIRSITHTGARNKFPLPEIIFDPSLILSSHVFLLGLIFADRAFAAPNLTSARQLSRLDIRSGYQQLELLLKPNMFDVPVFRKSIGTGYGYEISQHEPLSYPTLLSLMKAVSVIAGFLQPTRPYCLRYSAGNEFNQSGAYHVFPNPPP